MFGAWQKQQFAEMHRLRVCLSSNGWGPKKRNYLVPRCNLTAVSWESGLAAAPGDGGASATKINSWNALLQQTKSNDGEPWWVDSTTFDELIREKLRDMKRYLRKCPKRRAFPAWGVCAEMLGIALWPTEKVDDKVKGVGCEKGVTPRWDHAGT